MAGQRQPIELIVAKGKKHISKADIEARRASEVKPCTDNITPPAYLTAAQKKRFGVLAEQLQRIRILGETDTETLARYVTAQTQYEAATKDLRKMMPPQQTGNSETDMTLMSLYYKSQEAAARLQDRYFKQAQTAATSLGLTISSRCKLVVPETKEEARVNKFSRFGQRVSNE